MDGSIICAVEDSKSAPAVAWTGRQLASQLGCPPIYAHVAAAGTDVGVADGHGERRILHGGDAANDFVKLARSEEAQLLIAGSRGQGPLRAAMQGNVVRDLARNSPCPVVVVPPEVQEGDAPASVRTIVCGVDFSPHGERAVVTAAWLAKRLGLGLVLIHAVEPPSARVARAHPGGVPAPIHLEAQQESLGAAALQDLSDYERRLLGGEGDLVRKRVLVGFPVECLKRAAKEEDAGYITVGHRGLGRLRSVLDGSTSGTLAASAPRPVVIVPPNASLPSASGLAAPSKGWGVE